MTFCLDDAPSTLFEHAFHGALYGCLAGAGLASLVISTCSTGKIIQATLEIGIRALGMLPHWPLLKGDCQDQNFIDHEACGPGTQSFLKFSLVVLCSASLGGMVAGSIVEVSKAILHPDKSIKEKA